MNKKGEAFIIWVGLVAVNIVFAFLIRGDFREKKALKMCEESGRTDCVEFVDGMDKDDILDYIRDK